ncbi:MAG: hypothetical protein F6K30_23295 [Cyanothece sp. SIO2G6]|nr:hypothetical protein [Cyanothece sp. SIO2G6]
MFPTFASVGRDRQFRRCLCIILGSQFFVACLPVAVGAMAKPMVPTQAMSQFWQSHNFGAYECKDNCDDLDDGSTRGAGTH